MKNINVLLFSIIVSFFFISCNKEESLTESKFDLEDNGFYDMLFEHGSYQKEIQIFDENKTNSITLLLSSNSKELLLTHLEDYEYSIIPIYKSDESTSTIKRSTDTQQMDEVFEDVLPVDKISNIVTETVNKNLQEDVIGFTISMDLKNSISRKVTNPFSLVYYYSYVTKSNYLSIHYIAKSDDYSDGIIYKFCYKPGFLNKWRDTPDGSWRWLHTYAANPKWGADTRKLGVGLYTNRRKPDNFRISDKSNMQ